MIACWRGGSIAGNTASDGGGIFNLGQVSFAGASLRRQNAPNDCVDIAGGVGCLDFLGGYFDLVGHSSLRRPFRRKDPKKGPPPVTWPGGGARGRG